MGLIHIERGVEMLKNKIEEIQKRIGELEITILSASITEAKKMELLGIQAVYQTDFEEAEEEHDEKEMLALAEANESELLFLIKDYKLKI